MPVESKMNRLEQDVREEKGSRVMESKALIYHTEKLSLEVLGIFSWGRCFGTG